MHDKNPPQSKADKAIFQYDWHIRMLVAYLQAFINHHEDPSCFGLPDLPSAKKAWNKANDFNVLVFSENNQGFSSATLLPSENLELALEHLAEAESKLRDTAPPILSITIARIRECVANLHRVIATPSRVQKIEITLNDLKKQAFLGIGDNGTAWLVTKKLTDGNILILAYERVYGTDEILCNSIYARIMGPDNIATIEDNIDVEKRLLMPWQHSDVKNVVPR